MTEIKHRILIGITGASGSVYARQLIDYLRDHTNHQLAIVASPNGYRIFKEELNLSIGEMKVEVISHKDFDVPCVSGSNAFDKMVIVPASMGTIARVAHGISSDTLSRTADVMIKEKKQLIVVPRETPLSLIHLENLRILALNNVTIIPAIPSFYSLPQTIEELAYTVSSRILDHLGIPNDLTKRWTGK